MADDKKDNNMGASEFVGGLASGAAVGVGASAAYGATTLRKPFADLVKPGIEGMKKHIESWQKPDGPIAKLGKDFVTFVKKENITQEQYFDALKKVMPKYGATQDFVDMITSMDNGNFIGNGEDFFKALQKNMVSSLKDFAEKVKSPKDYTERVKAYTKDLIEALNLRPEAKAEAEKLTQTHMKSILSEAKSVLNTVENTGRKVISAVKYEHAKWYEKPVVAFEAMSTKGKVGLGVVIAASTLIGAKIINSIGSKDSDSQAR